ncbi:carboxypeptidase-like regulatory domain-containing protein [Natronoglycomyces albus]|uniref:Carboxypeptidase regulatory-like domain-containing protein n=1 Tax=Natronoglycomyces albus TaxID=2811108 RepID=A0A895XL87_9ACTN|nr:carboxypeptidase-like regulatory domain-containing protein [Natronoglycomyces albus]QSB06471.1 carboxypeptidase regulatory-like domain-containing protein [Natronoglycomyces albus]
MRKTLRLLSVLFLPTAALMMASCGEEATPGNNDGPDQAVSDHDDAQPPPSRNDEGATITVSVVDAEGNAVEGVFVQPAAIDTDPPHAFPEIAIFTDSNGEHEFSGLPPGTYEFTIMAEPNATEESLAKDVDVSERESATVEFVLAD